MKKALAFTIAIALAANAQKIETEKSDRHKVIRVETAPNHLSIIELAEPRHRGSGGKLVVQDRVARQQGVRAASRPGSYDEPFYMDRLRAFEL
jgi:hypothetical protein